MSKGRVGACLKGDTAVLLANSDGDLDQKIKLIADHILIKATLLSLKCGDNNGIDCLAVQRLNTLHLTLR
jgi:hypothetical protein